MCRSTFPMDRRRSQYRSPRRTSRRRVAAIFCLATHCLGWRVLPFMDFYDQKPTVYLHEFVRALMRTVPCWKSFQPPAASTRNASNVPLAVIRQRRSGGRANADVHSTEPEKIGGSSFGSLAPFDLTA